MTDYAVRVKGLGKRFVKTDGSRSLWRQMTQRAEGEEYFWALKDVNIDIRRGESFGLIGANGAGKSTLLKIISRILMPTEGEIELYGNVNSLLEVGTGFEPDLTGKANVYLNGSILGMSRKEIAAIYDEVVAFSGLAEFMEMPVKHYSSGMYARLAFSVAAYVTGDILAVDEVLSVGDAEFRRKSMKRMEDLMTGGGRTIIFVSHSSEAITRFCERAAWIDKGRIIEIGPADEIVRAYLGADRAKRTKLFGAAPNVDAAASRAAPELPQPSIVTAETIAAADAPPPEGEGEGQAQGITYLIQRGNNDERDGAGRILRAALVNPEGEPSTVVFRDERHFVDFEFDILRTGSPPIACFFSIKCLPRKGVPLETHVLSDFSRSRRYEPGRYLARVAIPPNLLTGATYLIAVGLRTIGKPMISHDTLKRVIEFQVIDRDTNADIGAENMFGVVRIDLEWEIEQLNALALAPHVAAQ